MDDNHFEQIYSLTRVCTLIAVVLNLVALDASSPINCQVCFMSSYTRAD